jgi:hypothetical protein
LQVRIAMEQRQAAQVVPIEPVQIVVTHADQQGRAAEVVHVSRG